MATRRRRHSRSGPSARPPTLDESGGAGGTFEEWIAAWFLLNLLAGTDVGGEAVAEVRLQTGLPLDDVGLVLASGRRVAVAVKDGSYVSARGLPPEEFVERCWKLLTQSDPGSFDRADDRMWLVVREMGGEARTLWRDLEDNARAGNAQHLARVADAGNAAMRGLRDRMQAPDHFGLGAAGDAWQLLSRLHVEVRDLGRELGHDQARVMQIARDLVADRNADEASRLWHALMVCAQERHLGVVFRRSDLLERLAGVRLAVLPDHRPMMARIADWEVTDFGVVSDIDGVHVTRAHVLKALSEALTATRLVALEGASGTGKTVLLKTATAADLGCTTLVRAGASRVATADAADELAGLIQALQEHVSERPVLVLDALDIVADGALAAVARLARELAASPNGRWRVILVCTRTRWPAVEEALTRAGARPGHVVAVGSFLPAEVDEVLRRRDRLRVLARSELFPLFSDPWTLARITDIDRQDPGATERLVGNASVVDFWWSTVLAPADPTGAARSAAVEVARRLADERVAALGTSAVDASTRLELGSMIAKGVVRMGARIEFAHDRFADTARAQWLDSAAIGEWKARATALRWRPALVLSAQRWLEREPARWASTARALDLDVPGDLDLLRILVEALWNSSDLAAALDAVGPVVLERRGVLLTLARQLAEAASGALALGLEVWRQPGWSRAWQSMVGWLARNAEVGLDTGGGDLLQAVAFGARFRDPLGIGMDDLGVLASTLVAQLDRALRDPRTRRVIGTRRFESPEFQEALLELAPFDRERAERVIRTLAGLLPLPEVPSAEVEERATTWSARQVGLAPQRDSPVERWPEGPSSEPVRGFADVAWSEWGAIALARLNGSFAVEVLTAVVIEPPRSRARWLLERHGGGSFLRPGCSFASQGRAHRFPAFSALFKIRPVIAAQLAVRLMNFATRADRAYRAEVREPGDAVVLESAGTSREYFGGVEGWRAASVNAGRGDVVDCAVAGLRDALGGVLDDRVRAAVHLLLLGCPSTTALGLLAREGERDPELFDGILEGLATNLELFSWSFEAGLIGGVAPGDRGPRVMIGPLAAAVAARWHARGRAWPKLEAARASWAEALEAGAVPEPDIAWVRKLSSFFDATRWREVDGGMEWTPTTAEVDAGRRAWELYGRIAGHVIVPFARATALDDLYSSRAPITIDQATALLAEVSGMQAEDFRTAAARAKAATVILRTAPPEEPSGVEAWRRAEAWVEDGILAAEARSGSIRYPDTEVLGQGAAGWYARNPADPRARRVATLAAACPEPSLARAFYDEVGRSASSEPAGFRALLHATSREAGRHYRTATWFAIDGEHDEQHADERRQDSGAVAAGALPDLPESPFPSGVELEGAAIGLLHAMTRWTRTTSWAASLRRPLCLEIDRVLRDQIAVGIAFHIGRARPEVPARLDDKPTEVEHELLATLAAYLVASGPADLDSVADEWLRVDRIPPRWVAAFLDGLLDALLGVSGGTSVSLTAWTRHAGRAFGVREWHLADGGLVHDLAEATLGLSPRGDPADVRWTGERAALLDTLADHQERWVEQSSGQHHHLRHLLVLGRTPAATGRCARFAAWIDRFPPAARRRLEHVDDLAAFLAVLIADRSFDRRDGIAERLLADVRTAGHPAVPWLERAILQAGA